MLGGKVKSQAASCKRICLLREVSVFTAFFKGDVLTPFGDGLVAGADDLSAVRDLFHAVGRPARDTRNRKEGCIELAGEIEHVVDET